MNVSGWLAALALHQDYFWALALFGWAATGWAWWRARGERALRWVPWAAAAGALTAGIELSQLITPVVPRPGPPSRIAWDVMLGGTFFFLAGGWLWSAADTRRRRFLAGGAIIATLAGAAFLTREVRPTGWAYAHRTAEQRARAQADPALRIETPIAPADVDGWRPALFARVSAAVHAAGAWPLALMLLAAAALHAQRFRPMARGHLIALGLTVAAAWAGSGGPLADLAHLPRASTQSSPFGPWSALLQVAAAGFLLAGLAAAARAQSGENRSEAETESRRMAVLAAAWLAAGFALASVMGWLARRQFEVGALGRARAAAIVVDTELLDRELGSSFQIAEIKTLTDAAGTFRVGVAPGLAAGGLRPIEAALQVIADANPDATRVSIVKLHNDLLLRVCSAARTPGVRTNVPVHRDATPADVQAWAQHTSFFAPPDDYAPRDSIAQAFAPLMTRDGRMLGWLWLAFRGATWQATQVQARLQAFATVGLGLGLLGVFYQLRREESRRAQAWLAELAAAEADRAKTALLAKVSHELRTPIQSILGYGELIAQQPLSTETRRWLESLRSHGQLLTRLVNDLIDLSSMQAGAFRLVPAPGNLGLLVRQATDSLRPRAAAKGLRIECLVSAGMEVGHRFDSERVRQVLLNLVNNAIKFTERGQVAIELRVAPGAPDFVELRVQDTGPGIAPEDQVRLFQPFSRLEAANEIEGAGLGLALSRALCVAMGGGLAVESDGEHGSTFIALLRLPPAPLPPPESVPEVQSLEGRRVLVADDNTLVRELFVSGLRTHGALCESVTDGLAAVERGTEEAFDVIVLDVAMPWLDGFEATRRLRRHAPAAIRIVGVSAHASAADRAEALAAGMDAFLVKPVMLADLVQAVAVSGTRAARAHIKQPPMLEHLRTLFAREVAQLRGEILGAAAAGDRERLRARVHYLKNSADIARYDALSLRCAQLESILRAGGEDATRLLAEIDRDLAPFCAPS